METIDRYVPLTDSGTGRLLWTQVQRDGWGNPELFVLGVRCKERSTPQRLPG